MLLSTIELPPPPGVPSLSSSLSTVAVALREIGWPEDESYPMIAGQPHASGEAAGRGVLLLLQAQQTGAILPSFGSVHLQQLSLLIHSFR